MLDKGIKNVVLDFGGVLIDLDRQRCIERFERLGVPDVRGLFREDHLLDGFLQRYEKGLISDGEFRACVREKTGHEVTDDAIDEAWNSMLVDIPAYKLDFLPELRKRYRLYLLSNTNHLHWEWACRNVFGRGGRCAGDYFDRIFLSYEMKMAKPDAEIFEVVLAQTGMLPQETLFLDDSEANCRTARSLGIVVYTPKAHEDWRYLFE